jgi:hypothetical protein
MSFKSKKSLAEMSATEKVICSMILVGAMLVIIYLYLATLQFSLKSYLIGIKWWMDIMVHTEKLDSIAYMVYGFFYTLFILGYPIVFIASVTACILLSPRWKGGHFGLALIFPGLFTFVVIGFSIIGHAFV